MRPCVEGDLPRLVELYRRVFGGGNGLPGAALTSQLDQLLFRHPWRDDRLPSLVYEDAHGRVIGCLGVVPRRFSLDGRPIQAAVSHTFMVEPGRRAGLAGLELLQAFLTGPQDLSLAEGSDLSRKLIEASGGWTSVLYSLAWTRPLRPARHALSILRRCGRSPAVAWILAPVCHAVDSIAPLLLPKVFRPPTSRLTSEPLEPETLVELLPAFCARRSLCPEYDPASLRWLFERLEQRAGPGRFVTTLLREPSGRVGGWYVYCLNPGGTSSVLQVVAREDATADVLDHLFHHAWRHGALALSGQLDPDAFPALSRKLGVVLHQHGGAWMLMHSRHCEVLDAIHRGDAFLTRLEGEWWITFLLSRSEGRRAGAE